MRAECAGAETERHRSWAQGVERRLHVAARAELRGARRRRPERRRRPQAAQQQHWPARPERPLPPRDRHDRSVWRNAAWDTPAPPLSQCGGV